MRTDFSSDDGFTVPEVLIYFFIVSVVSVSIYQLFSTAFISTIDLQQKIFEEQTRLDISRTVSRAMKQIEIAYWDASPVVVHNESNEISLARNSDNQYLMTLGYNQGELRIHLGGYEEPFVYQIPHKYVISFLPVYQEQSKALVGVSIVYQSKQGERVDQYQFGSIALYGSS